MTKKRTAPVLLLGQYSQRSAAETIARTRDAATATTHDSIMMSRTVFSQHRLTTTSVSPTTSGYERRPSPLIRR